MQWMAFAGKEKMSNMKKYIKSIERRLNLPRDVKRRVMSDLESSIQSRLEAGQTHEQIRAELGEPAQVAAELNEQMKEFAYTKSPWRWACLLLAVVSGLTFLGKGFVNLLVAAITYAENQSVGIIGGADGPTAIFVTQSQDSAIYSMLMSGLILVMSALGFYYLGHIRKK